MTRILTVNSWVGIRSGCSLHYRVNDSDDVEFTVGGGGHETFELVFDAAMLGTFLEAGTTALLEMAAHERD